VPKKTRVNRTVAVFVRVTVEDKARWVKAAKHAGLSFSQFIREALDRAA